MTEDAPSNKLAEIMRAAAARMRSEFDESTAFRHRPEKGRSRERILCDFIGPRVPGHVVTAHSAEIVAASGAVSPQCDVVLFDRSTPPLLDMEDYRIIPNECVYGVIEVKSSLNKTELQSACEAIRKVKAMPKTAYYPVSSYQMYNIHGTRYEHLPTLGLIFAFNGSAITTLGDHLWEWSREHPPNERPDGVYILGGGHLQWTSPENGLIDLYPSPGCGLLAFDKPESGTSLFPFMLHLSTLLTQASMWPLNLNDYAAEAPLGVVGKRFISPP